MTQKWVHIFFFCGNQERIKFLRNKKVNRKFSGWHWKWRDQIRRFSFCAHGDEIREKNLFEYMFCYCTCALLKISASYISRVVFKLLKISYVMFFSTCYKCRERVTSWNAGYATLMYWLLTLIFHELGKNACLTYGKSIHAHVLWFVKVLTYIMMHSNISLLLQTLIPPEVLVRQWHLLGNF